MRIAFITDLHFGRLTVGAAAALLADLRTQKPDLIVIGGDVTQRGLGGQYQQCQEFLAQLPAPWISVIGNHDVPAWNLLERFLMPYHAYQKFITRDLNPSFVMGELAIQGLNSARRMIRDGGWEQGKISPWQIDLTHQFFAQHPDKYKMVVVHHPVTHPVSRPARLLVRGHAAALAGFAAAGADMICTGHLHRSSIDDVSRNFVGADGAARKPLWVVMGSTALCDRLRGEPNGYWEITLGQGNSAPQFSNRVLVDGTFFTSGTQ